MIISRDDNINDDPFLYVQNFDINFQRLLKLKEPQNVYYQADLISNFAADEDYKSKYHI
jgi:hypothetical protein